MLFGLLVLAAHRYSGWAESRAGRLSFLFLTIYGFFRFFTDFYRDDDTYWGPFSNGQWFSLLTGVVGILLLMGVRGQATAQAEKSRGVETPR